MSRIPPLNDDAASPEAAAQIERMKRLWEGDWNLARVLAHSPNLLKAFADYWEGLQHSSLSAGEREIVSLELSRRHGAGSPLPADSGGDAAAAGDRRQADR
jgi:alkylhydroperoxidase family enzyme